MSLDPEIQKTQHFLKNPRLSRLGFSNFKKREGCGMERVKGLGDGEALERERHRGICGEHCTGAPSSKRSERDSGNKIGMYMMSYTLSCALV